jgi:uncharacterized protein
MERQDCIAMISRSGLGRLACARDNRPYAVPISYVYEDDRLYSFALEGQKLDWMRANPAVCVLVDEISTPQEWRSVVVEGRFEELPEGSEWKHRAHAWSLLQAGNPIWWVPGSSKPNQKPEKAPRYRITIEGMTGRQAFRNA